MLWREAGGVDCESCRGLGYPSAVLSSLGLSRMWTWEAWFCVCSTGERNSTPGLPIQLCLIVCASIVALTDHIAPYMPVRGGV